MDSKTGTMVSKRNGTSVPSGKVRNSGESGNGTERDRATISRSNILQGYEDHEYPRWFDLDQCLEEHLEDTYHKLPTLDDDIWGKVILMERNVRVAKAYLRQRVVTVNGSDADFDGITLGFKSFRNPHRDKATEDFRNRIGAGLRVRVEIQGDIVAKRFCKGPVTVYSASAQNQQDQRENAVEFARIRLPEGNRCVKIFDMRRFKRAMETSLIRGTQDAAVLRSLLLRTVVAFGLVREGTQLLNSPCWFFIINLIALDMISARYGTLPFPLRPPHAYGSGEEILGHGSAIHQPLAYSMADLAYDQMCSQPPPQMVHHTLPHPHVRAAECYTPCPVAQPPPQVMSPFATLQKPRPGPRHGYPSDCNSYVYRRDNVVKSCSAIINDGSGSLIRDPPAGGGRRHSRSNESIYGISPAAAYCDDVVSCTEESQHSPRSESSSSASNSSTASCSVKHASSPDSLLSERCDWGQDEWKRDLETFKPKFSTDSGCITDVEAVKQRLMDDSCHENWKKQVQPEVHSSCEMTIDRKFGAGGGSKLLQRTAAAVFRMPPAKTGLEPQSASTGTRAWGGDLGTSAVATSYPPQNHGVLDFQEPEDLELTNPGDPGFVDSRDLGFCEDEEGVTVIKLCDDD